MAKYTDWDEDGKTSIQFTCHVHQLQTIQFKVSIHELGALQNNPNVRMSVFGIIKITAKPESE